MAIAVEGGTFQPDCKQPSGMDDMKNPASLLRVCDDMFKPHTHAHNIYIYTHIDIAAGNQEIPSSSVRRVSA